jgi:hypothetical protein
MRLEPNTPGFDSLAPALTTRSAVAGRADLLNIGAILVTFACVLLLVAPVRTFPINDDWTSAQSIAQILNGTYRQHDFIQTIALAHLMWGALFAFIFGLSFTTLSIANLFMSAICLLVFYLLLRNLGVEAKRSLLGVALLGFNPIYVHVSYSFLTDVTFLTLMLAALLCYTRGLSGYGSHWFWLGGLATSASYLTRQFGILAAIAPLLYLLLARRWKWRDALAITALPALTLIGYALWEQTQPVQLIDFAVQTVSEGFLADPGAYVAGRSMHLVWTLFGLGIYVLPVMRLPRRPILSLPIFALLGFFLFKSGQAYGTLVPRNGNTVDHTGYSMVGYNAQMVWSQPVWAFLSILSALLLSLYVVYCLESLWRWFRPQEGQNRTWEPGAVAYLLALMLAGTIVLLTPTLYDRYWLGVLPLLLLPGLTPTDHSVHGQQEGSRRALALRWLLLIPIVIFSIVAQRDYMEHAAAQWSGAERLVAQGARRNQVSAGFEWEGWYLYEEGARRLREKPLKKYIPFPPSVVLDPVYVVSDEQQPGYKEIGSVPYRSWLNGGEERLVRLLRRE